MRVAHRGSCASPDAIFGSHRPSPAFSTTAASAFRTMPPSAPCAVLPWGAGHGCSPVPTAAANAPQQCTRGSPRPNLTTSPRRPGSPTCSPASPITRRYGSTNSCRGTGRRPGRKPPRREHRPPRSSPDAYLCSERKGRSSSRRLRSGSRSARKGSRDRNASQGLAVCRLAALVFRSALTPERAER